MSRHLILIIFIGLAWGQDPCDDKLLNELEMKIKSNGLEALNDREWSYYKIKSEECSKSKLMPDNVIKKSSINTNLQVQNSEDNLNFIATKVCCSILIRISAIIFITNLLR